MLKRMLLATLLVSGAASPLVACGGSQKDVEVKGKETETAKLAGDWEGTYEGRESGRSGTVKFSLQLGRHTAEGEVYMGGETPLNIQFIEVEGGQIQGTIAPYTDPNCDCQVETSFLGIVTGDEIKGEFSTKVGATGQIQTGTWQVSRTAK
ncbi:MAG: hypothetical protein F9K40_17915 [Kofleriaceae bacterium]|nr:MAG: hypothetical protein F9K40_17915 [Kofleriaceae bacterium]